MSGETPTKSGSDFATHEEIERGLVNLVFVEPTDAGRHGYRLRYAINNTKLDKQEVSYRFRLARRLFDEIAHQSGFSEGAVFEQVTPALDSGRLIFPLMMDFEFMGTSSDKLSHDKVNQIAEYAARVSERMGIRLESEQEFRNRFKF